MIVQQEGQDLIKHAAQATIVILIISYPGWRFLPHPANMRQQETNTVTDENVSNRTSKATII
jgi:hypothetical protein